MMNASFEILTVPGVNGSGENHWQTRWERAHPEYRRVEQHDWAHPQIDVWSARVAEEVRYLQKPALLVAHSFGCLAVVAAAQNAGIAERICGALLVAPAEPALFGIDDMDLARAPLPFISTLVASSNDAWLTLPRARELAQQWGSCLVEAGMCGHINAESHLGDWAAGQRLLEELQAAVQFCARAA